MIRSAPPTESRTPDMARAPGLRLKSQTKAYDCGTIPWSMQDVKAVMSDVISDLMSDQALPRIDHSRCSRCGLCVAHCPSDAVEMTAQGPVIARPGDCSYCTACEMVCPENAIRCPYEIVWAS